MSKWEHARNDGWKDVDYQLLEDAEGNARLARILNEACHVFHRHAEGNWASHDKDSYALQIACEIARSPSLQHRLLRTGDRVIKMLTYRAMELRECKRPDLVPTNEPQEQTSCDETKRES